MLKDNTGAIIAIGVLFLALGVSLYDAQKKIGGIYDRVLEIETRLFIHEH